MGKYRFKKDKWYKYNHSSGFYLKSDRDSKDTIYYSEYISICTGKHEYQNHYYKNEYVTDEEVSLEEVRKYLPEGHPDKITSDVFKKGEYIVLIGKGQSTGSATLLEDFRTFIQNHCYKVRESCEHLRVELDSTGSKTNGWKCIPYNPNKFHKTRNWRYATQEEIDGYERRGKPYDVTELQKKQLSMKEIQEKCKRRFPIGCTFIPVGSCESRVLKEDSSTYFIAEKMIYAHSGSGSLYSYGKWAKLVSSPKQKDLKEEAIKYSEKTNTTILLASDIKSKELCSTYEETLLSVKLLSNKTTHLINNVRVLSSVNLKIK